MFTARWSVQQMVEFLRRAWSAIPSIALSLSLGGCDLSAVAEYQRIATMEHDIVPPLYQGPLVVEGTFGGIHQVSYSEGGRRRIDLLVSSGASHALADPQQGLVYRWSDFGRDKGVLHAARMAPETRAALERWLGHKEAQRRGRCVAAGEVGDTYRYTRGPNLQGPGGNYIEACITRDGVVLSEGMGADPIGDSGRHSAYKAHLLVISVRRTPLPPDVFKLPAGLRRASP